MHSFFFLLSPCFLFLFSFPSRLKGCSQNLTHPPRAQLLLQRIEEHQQEICGDSVEMDEGGKLLCKVSRNKVEVHGTVLYALEKLGDEWRENPEGQLRALSRPRGR